MNAALSVVLGKRICTEKRKLTTAIISVSSLYSCLKVDLLFQSVLRSLSKALLAALLLVCTEVILVLGQSMWTWFLSVVGNDVLVWNDGLWCRIYI